jgi:AraC family transcriptional regulator
MSAIEQQFRGGTLRMVQEGGLALLDQKWTHGTSLPAHGHDHAWFTFVFAGEYVERLSSFDRVCRAGSVIWHPPGLVHENRFLSDGHNFNLVFDPEYRDMLPPDVRLPAKEGVWAGGVPFRFGLELYRSLNTSGRICEEAAIDLIVLAACSPASRRPEWLLRILEVMNDEYSASLTLIRAAERAGVHPVHVSRSFRCFLGCTFREHLRLIRLNRAMNLLKRSSAGITEIAAACGFSDHAHLTRTLKRATGLTPSRYRAQTG